ncbi:hypothetical protein CR205_12360 [Alteribacter lacisalsi]|uniref:Transglutaminase-like domain-containing protein n=1 Tax=Alteribacter lacisalsi TaxID=2045244 RepID=A0A2W0H3U8_9BACI|nr:hypothetical protein [Alteribacter lacisalsi]PYZ96504.1 hypothetical protein CR205_12360 [Alteribacter lacisalsi]
MARLHNFKIKSRMDVSTSFLRLGIHTFHEAADFVTKLPYGRNTDRADYTLVLKEKQGTCSTKHALLASLCEEHGIKEVQLYTGIYEMNETNTPGTGAVLNAYGLSGLPEAHCYLKYDGSRFDFTRPGAKAEGILTEKKISPAGIGEAKITFHRRFIEDWIEKKKLTMQPEKLWAIREECIQALSVR